MIDAIQKELGLSKDYVEPSRAALYRYGNVSSSSVWYVLSFIEHFRSVKAGDRVLQVRALILRIFRCDARAS